MFHSRKAFVSAVLSDLSAVITRGAKKSAAKLPVVLLQASFVWTLFEHCLLCTATGCRQV